MAATGTPTPNIGLRIPLGTDPASVDDINFNSNLIDTKLGAVGNDSVQDQLNDLNSSLVNSYGELATGITYQKYGKIVIIYFNGNTVTASSGWSDILTVPATIGQSRYTIHHKVMTGQDVRIAGDTVAYRGSAGDMFGFIVFIAS